MAHIEEDSGSSDSATLEREVNAERKRVAQTIDALQDKASLGSVIDQLVTSFGAQGQEAGRNLGRAVRDNPLPLLLTGVGLAWLMSSNGQSDRDAFDDRHYGALDRGGPRDRSDAQSRALGAQPGSTAPTLIPRPTPVPTGSTSWAETADGGAPGQTVGDAVKETVQAACDRVSGSASAAQDAAGHAADATARSVDAMRRQAERHGRRAGSNLDEMFRRQPLVAGALALAAGVAVGSALPRTRTEDELFGEHSDTVRNRVAGAAEEEADRLADAASGAVDRVNSAAEGAVARAADRAPDGSDLVETAERKLSGVARRAGERASGTDTPGDVSESAPGPEKPGPNLRRDG